MTEEKKVKLKSFAGSSDQKIVRVPAIGLKLRAGLDFFDILFDRIYSSKYNPLYQSGVLAIGLLLILLATGLYTFLFYQTGAPYESVLNMHNNFWLGRWIRSLHRYSGDLLMIAVAVHFTRMFLQGKTWGPRVLAWVTGVALMGILLFCGWTGLILVWDVQGQLVAFEGARILDVLPLFPEPIARAFISNEALPSSFFFINLFIHVAIPLGLVFMIWLHVLKVPRVKILPSKPLFWGCTFSLIVLSLAWPVEMLPEANLENIPGRIPINWFFNFWLPLIQDRSPTTAFVFWIGFAIFAFSIPWWWRPKAKDVPQPSSVNERLCQACDQCYEDCPFDAITMVPRSYGEGSELVARVAPDKCVSCGICSGSCRPMTIGPSPRTARDLLRDVRAFSELVDIEKGKCVVVSCRNNAKTRELLEKQEGVVPFYVECVGSFHLASTASLIKRGARGVFFWSCPPRNCHFREGVKWFGERLYNDRELELPKYVDRRRVDFVSYGRGESDQALEQLDVFKKTLDRVDEEQRNQV
jgi:ferredoxin